MELYKLIYLPNFFTTAWKVKAISTIESPTNGIKRSFKKRY